MKPYRLFVMTIFIMTLALPALHVEARTPSRYAALALTAPTPDPVSVGSEVTVDLFLSVADITPGVTGVDVYLKYNPALVEPAPGAMVATVLPDFFGTQASISQVSNLPASQCPNSNGPCVHLIIAGPPQTTKDGLTARFRFRALAAGSACFSVIQSDLADADGYAVEHLKAEPKCGDAVVNTSATGIINRQGRSAISNPNNLNDGNLACSVVAANGGLVFTDRNGSFTMPNLPAGSHTLTAVYSGYLPSQTTVNVALNNPPVINFSSTTLRGGDVNGDLVINILDVRNIINKFGQTPVPVGSVSPNCAGVDEAADINDDGSVNIGDLAIAVGNWGLVAPTPWQP